MKQEKKISLRCVYLLLCILALSSCSTTKVGLHPEMYVEDDFPAFRKQCIGQTYNQIVTSLGAPQRQSPDGNGGNILVYENTTTTSISSSIAKAYDVNYATGTYTPGLETATQQTTTTDYVQYFVNSNNICYEVKTNISMRHTKMKMVDGKYKDFSWGKTLGLIFGIPTLIGALVVLLAGGE